MRIIVTGSRHADERHRAEVDIVLRHAVGHIPVGDLHTVTFVHGNQRGLDLLVESIVTGWARPAAVERHDASEFGPWPAAGPKRNAFMVSLGADVCLGFPLPGSRGTWDCAKRAADAGILTVVRTLTRH